MDLAYSLCGFLVGALVGFTGIGGGSVMTPLLILLFGVHPLAAVGTDLLYAAVTKALGAKVHASRGNVEWRVVGLLALGSVPATLVTIFFMTRLLRRAVQNSPMWSRWRSELPCFLLPPVCSSRASVSQRRLRKQDLSTRNCSRLTVLLGLLLGVLVSLTSVGVGAIGIVVLRHLYPRLPAVRLVGSDIAHAVPLTLLAGSGHWLIGDINWGLLGSLLIGSIPGIILASRSAHQVSDRTLRRVLAVVLFAVAAPMAASDFV